MTSGEKRRSEESVSFSLKELEKLESERLDREKKEREARVRAAQLAKEDAERREREALAAKERAEEESRDARRRAEIEEQARLEAMSRAAVEQARIGVETKARAEEAERERQHEVELAKIRALSKGQQSSFAPMIVSGLFGFVVAAATCAGLFFGVSKPASDRTIATLESSLSDAQQKTRDLQRENLDQDRRIKELEKKLDGLATAPAPTTPSPSRDGTTKKNPPLPPGHQPIVRPNVPDPCEHSPDPLCGLDRGKH
jgi:colicin import membrane protein